MNKIIIQSILNKAIDNGQKIKLLDAKAELLQIDKKEKLITLYRQEIV